MADYTTQFTIDEKGDVTGKDYAGVFTVKTRLTHNDRFKQDAIKRGLLGGDPTTASPQAQSMAEAFSQISIRVIDAPDWWKQSDGGTQLADFSVITSIYTKAIEAENAEIDKVVKSAKNIKESLKTPIINE